MTTSKKEPDDRPRLRGISKAEVLDRVPISYPQLWMLMRAGAFPRSRQVGGRSLWLEHEIDAWLAALPVRPLKGDDKAAA